MGKTKKLKIGITLGLKSNDESIWTNGIKQNVLMLLHLLQNSEKEYEVCILNSFKVDFTERPSYLEGINIYNWGDKFIEQDLIIIMGAQVRENDLKKFRENKDKKVISYKCGNNYVLSMEEMLFKESTAGHYEQEVDEVWYIPQQDEVNRGYYEVMHRAKPIMVPFVWHHKYIAESTKTITSGYQNGSYKKSWEYNPNKEKKVIGIMEPNINIVKFCLIPTLIVEECYRGEIGNKLIEKLRITNHQNLKKDKKFLSILKTFDLLKDGKISSEARYQTSYILTQFLDIVVSHQLLNPLNYLYLDAAFLGYPVLHNAELCSDLGYYYKDSDVTGGAEKLSWILENHDSNIKEYHKKNNKVLKRYHADNQILVKQYDLLIENLFNGKGNTHLSYNPKTNTLL